MGMRGRLIKLNKIEKTKQPKRWKLKAERAVEEKKQNPQPGSLW